MAIVKPNENLIGCEIRGKLGKKGQPDPLRIHGIYRVWRRWGKVQNLKQAFYVPTNPQSEKQQANRQKFADAVAGWQGLTSKEKSVYNKRAGGLRLSGYNLYIKEFLNKK